MIFLVFHFVFIQWVGTAAISRRHVTMAAAERLWPALTFLLWSSDCLPEKSKENPVKCMTDGDADAKPSHGGVEIPAEMIRVVLPRTVIKPLSQSAECRQRHQVNCTSTEMEAKSRVCQMDRQKNQ